MMKSKIILAVMIVLCSMSMANNASSDIIRGIEIDFVTIDNPGNPGDTRPEANPTGCGSVDYEYQMGKYEVTNAQWDAFVSAAGDPKGSPSSAYDDWSLWYGNDSPTNMVSWYEAAQFCNYLTTGDKSQGAYLFSGNNNNPSIFLGIDRDSAVSDYGIVYVLPTEDEWYKAAYYTGSGYSTYANGEESIPTADMGWNYSGGSYDSPWQAGTGTMEQNGTYDMMGNVGEWTETPIVPDRIIRTYSYHFNAEYLSSSARHVGSEFGESGDLGFRIASITEPTTLLLLGLGVIMSRKKR